MNNINKITEGNAFAINIRQAVWRTLGGVIQPLQASELVDVHLYVGSGSSKSTATEYPVTADGDTISAVMPATLKRGVYRTWLTALYQGREVASACECAFEIVPFDERKGVFAPERIDGEPCVYLQGVSMSDAELEAQKTYYRALIKQKEDEIAMLAKEREKLTNVAMQLDGVDESLDGISETLDGVAKEDTQQEIKKALDLVKAEISVEDKLNIRNAIELKGGQSVYKNPENPALLELAKNVGTIPQEFMTLEPEGVRYDDPIEWHAFNKDVADAVDAARALQNKIDAEGGIQSILHSDVKYKGFILIEYCIEALTYYSVSNTLQIPFSFNYADAYLFSYSSNAHILREKDGNETMFYHIVSPDGLADYGHFYIFYLFKNDNYTADISVINSNNRSISNIVVGGHPESVRLTNFYYIKGVFVQLNITNKTDYDVWNGIDNCLGVFYLRNKTGNLKIRQTHRLYLEQYEEGSFVKNDTYHIFAPKLKKASSINTSLTIDPIEFNVESCENVSTKSFSLSLPMVKSIYQICNFFEITNVVNLNLPELEELNSNSGDSRYGVFCDARFLNTLTLPKLKFLRNMYYHWLVYKCPGVEEIYMPELEMGSIRFASECPRLRSIIFPKLKQCFSRSYSYMNVENCPNLRKIILGNVESSVWFGCVGANDLIHFEFAEMLEYSINMTNWQPTNAINDSISTLVEEGEEFANNREKFLWNFRNYIIAMLHDYAGTGETRTLTLHSMVANVLTDEDKLAITNKGWILSIV